MKSFTKKLGLLMLVFVLALCPLIATGCSGDDDGDVETNIMLVGGFTSVELETGIKEFSKVLALHEYDEEKDVVKLNSFESCTAISTGWFRESLNGVWGDKENYTASEIFVNTDGAVRYMWQAEDEADIYYIDASEDAPKYYYADKSSDGILKRQYSTRD